MIHKFVDAFMRNRKTLQEYYQDLVNGKDFWCNYRDIVTAVVDVGLTGTELDPDRITEIDHGDYQGALVYVIAEKGYQPWDHYAVVIDYGSCSGCDTLEAALCQCDKSVVVADLMVLSLHIVQRLKSITPEDD